MLNKLLALLCACAVAFSPAIHSQAAANNALAAPYDFKNVKMTNTKAFLKTNSIYFRVGTGLKGSKYNAADLSVSAVVYIPKNAIAKEGYFAGVDITGIADPGTYNNNSEAELLVNKAYLGIEKKGGKMVPSGVEALTDESIDPSAYLKVKSGKGKYSGYYILKVKNMPYAYLNDTPASGMLYLRDVIVNVFGAECKSSGVIYVDNIKVNAGGKTLCNFTFDSKKGTPEYCWVLLNDKEVTGASVAQL